MSPPVKKEKLKKLKGLGFWGEWGEVPRGASALPWFLGALPSGTAMAPFPHSLGLQVFDYFVASGGIALASVGLLRLVFRVAHLI